MGQFVNNISVYFSEYFKKRDHIIIFTATILVSFVLAILQSVAMPSLIVHIVKTRNGFCKVVALLLLIFALFFIKMKLEWRCLIDIRHSAREMLFKSIINKYSEDYKEADIGSHITRVFDGTRHCIACTMSFTRHILPQLFSVLCISIAVMVLNFNVGMPLLVGFLFSMVLKYFLGRSVVVSKQTEEAVFCKINNNMNNTLKNLMNTYINNEMQHTKNGISHDQHQLRQTGQTATHKTNTLSYAVYLNTLVWVLISLHLLLSLKETENTSLILMFLVLYISLNFSLASEISVFCSSLGFSCGIAPYLIELKNYNKEWNNRAIQSSSIEIKNLTFQYKGKKPLFKNYNLRIEDGEKVAVMGRSGSGKSSIAQLLIKLHSNYKGTIKIGNVNIRTVSPDYIRSIVIYVNQRTVLIKGSVMENIKFGNRSVKGAYVVRKLEKHGLMGIFANLTNGLDEQVVEGGANLSLGMQKIIFLVRGILKCKQGRIIIFDEPLSGLDPETRTKVLNMIKQECQNKTLLIITHDMEVKKIVDRTYNLTSHMPPPPTPGQSTVLW
jgi:ATP-binding cassette subfamily C protein